MIKIYTTSNCPYCHAAKSLFNTLKLDFEEINLDQDNELRMELSKSLGGWRTVPMIFIGKEFIGGYTDFIALQKDQTRFKKLMMDA